MKRLIITLVILLGLATASFAQGGMFQRGAEPDMQRGNRDSSPMMPTQHGLNDDVPGDGGTSPLGSGVAVLVGLGAAYLIGKKRSEE